MPQRGCLSHIHLQLATALSSGLSQHLGSAPSTLPNLENTSQRRSHPAKRLRWIYSELKMVAAIGTSIKLGLTPMNMMPKNRKCDNVEGVNHKCRSCWRGHPAPNGRSCPNAARADNHEQMLTPRMRGLVGMPALAVSSPPTPKRRACSGPLLRVWTSQYIRPRQSPQTSSPGQSPSSITQAVSSSGHSHFWRILRMWLLGSSSGCCGLSVTGWGITINGG